MQEHVHRYAYQTQINPWLYSGPVCIAVYEIDGE